MSDENEKTNVPLNEKEIEENQESEKEENNDKNEIEKEKDSEENKEDIQEQKVKENLNEKKEGNDKEDENINEINQKEEEENVTNEEKKIIEKDEEKSDEDEKKSEEDDEEEAKEEEECTSTYILKYTRKSNEPRESAYDKELIKSKQCLFMIEFKILKNKSENFLLIYVHEIAAIYFDEIYEKKYSINDLYKENIHFRIFDDVEETKKMVDEILNNNTTNSKKIFIDLLDNNFRLHIKITFFDKEKEIIFNVPKKEINDKERIRLLPEFLKEIQIKMNHLEEENKKLKNENKYINESSTTKSSHNFNGGNENLYSGTDSYKNIKIKML